MKILELLLMIIVKLMEIVSSSKNSSDTNSDNSTELSKKTSGFEEPITHNTINQPQIKSISLYNEEVNDLIAKVMSSHRDVQERDQKEIMLLRSEVSRLQEELILVKAQNARLYNVININTKMENSVNNNTDDRKLIEENDKNKNNTG